MDRNPWRFCTGIRNQRWRIEEAFKRLKHRLHLEAVSGLTQQALIVDVAAKVLADNIASLMCATAQAEQLADAPERLCNRSYACALVHPSSTASCRFASFPKAGSF